jgi:hypothetical protein
MHHSANQTEPPLQRQLRLLLFSYRKFGTKAQRHKGVLALNFFFVSWCLSGENDFVIICTYGKTLTG